MSSSLETLKAEAERLWSTLISTPGEENKRPLREEYRNALALYRRQLEITREMPEREPAVPQQERPKAPRPKQAPSPFSFVDYREFLLEWIRSLEDEEDRSFRAFAERSGVGAERLARALKRWEPLSGDEFTRILDALSLPTVERQFLEALHTLSDTDSAPVRHAAMRRLLAFAGFRKAHPQEYEAWRYLTHWFYVAIYEMSRLGGFRADPEWIGPRLMHEVEAAEIDKAIHFLEGAGFFRVREDRGVEPKLKDVHCAGGIFRLALGQFHREMLGLASQAIERIPSSRRTLLGHTVALSRKNFDQVRRILEEAMTRIAQLDPAEDSHDDVYHIELVAMPITRADPQKA